LPRIQVDSLTLDYTENGTGVPIIFIPGITEFKETFVFQLRGLGSSYRVISYDIRRGLKRATDYNLDLLVNDLRLFMRALGLDSAVICGHSFGGLIAMQFALQYPQETKALILVSSFASPPHAVPSERFSGYLSAAGHPLRGSIGNFFKLHMARLWGRKSAGALTFEHQISALKSVAHQAANVAPTTVLQRMRIVEKADFRNRLGDITSPTLIVAGSKDRSFFLCSAQQLYESIPDSDLEVIEGTGHFCFLTRHDEFNMVVDDFLSARLASIS